MEQNIAPSKWNRKETGGPIPSLGSRARSAKRAAPPSGDPKTARAARGRPSPHSRSEENLCALRATRHSAGFPISLNTLP